MAFQAPLGAHRPFPPGVDLASDVPMRACHPTIVATVERLAWLSSRCSPHSSRPAGSFGIASVAERRTGVAPRSRWKRQLVRPACPPPRSIALARRRLRCSARLARRSCASSTMRTQRRSTSGAWIPVRTQSRSRWGLYMRRKVSVRDCGTSLRNPPRSVTHRSSTFSCWVRRASIGSGSIKSPRSRGAWDMAGAALRRRRCPPHRPVDPGRRPHQRRIRTAPDEPTPHRRTRRCARACFYGSPVVRRFGVGDRRRHSRVISRGTGAHPGTIRRHGRSRGVDSHGRVRDEHRTRRQMASVARQQSGEATPRRVPGRCHGPTSRARRRGG